MIKTLIAGNPEFKKEAPDTPLFLEVAEFFMDTIQGEGINIGHPAAFLRMQHCTMNCVWCFHPNTKVLTYRNGRKKIKDIKKGDILLTLDEQENIVQTTVQETMKRSVSIENHLLKIETDNKKDNPLVVTKNHSLFVKGRGWTEAKDIKQGDILISVEGQQIRSYLMNKKNPMFDPATKNKILKTQKKLRKQGIIRPYKRTKENKELLSISKTGDKNPMKRHDVRKKSTLGHTYKKSSLEKRYELYFKNNNLPIENTDTKLAVGNKENGFHFPDFVIQGKKKVLEVYDTTFPLYVNGVRTKENYEDVRQSHYNKFGYEVLFLTEKDLKDKALLQDKLFSFVFNGKVVTDITNEFSSKSYAALFGDTAQKETKVYNLSCFPYNTYLANGVLAHNCDTQEVWRYGNPYTFEELFVLIEEHGLDEKLRNGQRLILTGG
ncbi:MAG: polymorphic toxin-type HINT domain-containing protein, partial [Bacteroidales bacterium]